MDIRAVAAVLVGTCTLITPSASADVYTWVDASGLTTVSNLPPPDGVNRVSVVRSAPKDPAREAALREAAREAEVRALNERVQQLQMDVARAKQDMAYAAPPVQYAAQQPAPYVIVVSPPAPAHAEPPIACTSGWNNCGFGFWPGFYPSSVFVLDDRHSRRHHAHHRHARPHPHPHVRAIGHSSWSGSSPIGPPLARSSVVRK